MNSTIAPIGLYTWRRWNDSQSITMPIPVSPAPTGLFPSANNNNS